MLAMVAGRGWNLLQYTMLATTMAVGCANNRDAAPAVNDPVVAIVDGVSITAHELDDSIRPQLEQLDRSRYELRARQLRRVIAARVLGKEDKGDSDAAFAAARKKADIDILLAPPARSGDSKDNKDGKDDNASNRSETAQSTLPVSLVGTIVREDPAKSLAAVRVPGVLLARNVQVGQTVVDGAVLVRVERNRIVLQRDGALEFVPLSVITAASTPTAQPQTPPGFVPTPNIAVTLRRSDVDRALRDVAALERSLTEAPTAFDGRRLLVVSSAEPGTLYDLLQLQDRDVLMQVNGEWVDDSHNPLWDALRSDETVTLMIMRAGQPHSFAYTID